MCLILIAWRRHAGFPLVVAANRDELHSRPAARAGFWKDRPAILAGRDLEAGGTWMGVSRSGRFAAVTNYRGGRDANAAESRGVLVTNFLLGSKDPNSYSSETEQKKNGYSGFNLLVSDGGELWWLSNRDGGPRRLEPGFYALGNFLLDTPEVQDVKSRFEVTVIAIEPLFRLLSTAKIVNQTYGTRCSTVLLQGEDGRTQFAERSFDAAGSDGSTLRNEFRRAG
ncbi:MAG TPA: NRDE family protein [Burkholderiales bacterium]|nr:NRDE family protein [Burkholderiales bacterium]